MSVIRVLVGIGTAGITSAGLFLGAVKSNKFKMWTFRRTATTIKERISANRALSNAKAEIVDPEDGWWRTHWENLKQGKVEHQSMSLENFSDKAKDNWESFRDECFEKMERRKDDLKEQSDASVSITDEQSKEMSFWENCLRKGTT